MKDNLKETNELAVSVKTQQIASLYAIGTVLVGTGKVPDKKAMKKQVKLLRKYILEEISSDEIEGLVKQQIDIIHGCIYGAKNMNHMSSDQKKRLTSAVIEDFFQSYNKGVSKL